MLDRDSILAPLFFLIYLSDSLSSNPKDLFSLIDGINQSGIILNADLKKNQLGFPMQNELWPCH